MNDIMFDMEIPPLGNEFGGPVGARAERFGVDMGMFHMDPMGGAAPFGIGNPLLDPLFMRPPQMVDHNGLPIPIPGGYGNLLVGGAGLPPNPAGLDRQDNALFNHYFRN